MTMAAPWAGAVEIPMSLIVMILAVIGLGPPLVVSLVVTAVHVNRRQPGDERRGGRIFLQCMALSTVVWVGLLWLNGLD